MRTRSQSKLVSIDSKSRKVKLVKIQKVKMTHEQNQKIKTDQVIEINKKMRKLEKSFNRKYSSPENNTAKSDATDKNIKKVLLKFIKENVESNLQKLFREQACKIKGKKGNWPIKIENIHPIFREIQKKGLNLQMRKLFYELLVVKTQFDGRKFAIEEAGKCTINEMYNKLENPFEIISKKSKKFVNTHFGNMQWKEIRGDLMGMNVWYGKNNAEEELRFYGYDVEGEDIVFVENNRAEFERKLYLNLLKKVLGENWEFEDSDNSEMD